jgi:thymidylate synthase ThyX/uncharacterized protein (UPF0297 family)
MNSLENLIHLSKKNEFAEVLILEDGAIITPEDRAMLQALHSRSSSGIKSHLQKLAKSGSGKMMSQFYVGYGHKSIGDCGFITLFIENISLLAAKAIQDSQLYNGQESSTRYIDFASQPFYNPINSSIEPHEITDILREFYIKSLPIIIDEQKKKYPIKPEENEVIYEKAIKARAFDIIRAFLPAGALTNIAWTANLRQVADRLMYLRHHPLKEVRDISKLIDEAVKEKYPNSFNHKIYESTENFIETYSNENYLYQIDNKNKGNYFKIINQGINKEILNEHFQKLLISREKGTEIPKNVGVSGSDSFYLEIDFGSYRDLQRHRAINQTMPLLTTKLGFEKWYLDNLPIEIKDEAGEIINKVLNFVSNSENDIDLQYYIPIGFKVGYLISGDLPSLTYLAEIRSSLTVHPTARNIALHLAKYLENEYQIPLFYNEEKIGSFDIKRGKQDIEIKN